MTPSFHPSFIYIDETVAHLPRTQAMAKKFPGTAVETVSDPKKLKRPLQMTGAKKGLLLTRFKADLALKPFSAAAHNTGRPHYSLNLISNCHLECTYCILQSYLANNPLITVYTNLEEILAKAARQLTTLPANSVIGTGQIADSLALEPLTGYAAALIEFFSRQNHGALLELKTKSDAVETLLPLNHRQKTVVSFSLNPPVIVEREEYKTASVTVRLAAARRCAEAGYKIGFHLDPMIWHENWQKNYAELVEQIFEAVSPEKIVWMSLGVLRFPARQRTVMQKRFPKNREILEGLKHTHLPYLTYPAEQAKEMTETARSFIRKRAPSVELYDCLEWHHG